MHRLSVATVAACLLLSGCGTTQLFKVNTEASPAVQKIQAEANARLTDRLAERLRHCQILGNLDVIAKASTEAGLTTGAGISCEPQPWASSAEQTQLIVDAVMRAVEAREVAAQRK